MPVLTIIRRRMYKTTENSNNFPYKSLKSVAIRGVYESKNFQFGHAVY